MPTRKLLVIPVISRVSARKVSREFIENIYKKLKERNKNIEIKIFDPIVDERNLEEVIPRIDNELKDYNGFVIAHLTGGTSKIALEILTNLSVIKPFALLAFSSYNSMPSALNTRERMLQMLSRQIYIPIIYEQYELESLAKRFYIVDKTLKRYNVLFLGPAVGIKVPFNFRLIRSIKLSHLLRKVSDEEIEGVLKSTKDMMIEFKGSENEKKAIALYINLRKAIDSFYTKRKMENAPLVCIECYYFMRKIGIAPCLAVSLLLKEGVLITCQRDVFSLFIMLLLHFLTDQPIWVADLSKIDIAKNSIVFSHSCSNLAMIDGMSEAIYHPLTNLPFAVRARFKLGEKVTIVSINPITEEFEVQLGEVIGPKEFYDDIEASQMEVRLQEQDVTKLIESSLRGHYVLVYGDWKEEIEEVYKILRQTRTMLLLKGK